MRFSHSVLVLAVLVLPVTASAQHPGGRAAHPGGGAVHPGAAHGGMPHPQHPGMQHPLNHQFNMMQQMMMQEAYLQEQRLLMQQARRQAQLKSQQVVKKSAPQRAGLAPQAAPRGTVAIRSLSTATQGPKTSQQPKHGNASAASQQPKHGHASAASHPASTAQTSARQTQAAHSRVMTSHQASRAARSKAESSPVHHGLEKERERKHRRWGAFRTWLLQNGLFATYSPWFQTNNSVLAFENWLSVQQARRLQGLPTDPLYDQFLAFQGQYTY